MPNPVTNLMINVQADELICLVIDAMIDLVTVL